MTRKKQDMRVEHELAKFLDKYFYPYLCKKENCFSERKEDIESQYAGIDVCLCYPEKDVNIDEKAQLYYINNDLPTFAFEINFINRRGELSLGWLLNNKLKTDCYLLVWPFADTCDLTKIKEENFTKMDCLLIDKKKIQEYLKQEGLTDERILKDAKQIRSGKQTGKIIIPKKEKIYYFFSPSEKYKEVPINIIIRREILNKLAYGHYIITKSGVEVINKI